MKDIGSIFPLYEAEIKEIEPVSPLCSDHRNHFFSLCREALSHIAAENGESYRKVLIPAYTCSTVIIPFVQQGWECMYYKIGKDLRIQTEETLEIAKATKPNIFVAHPFYGMDLTEEEMNMIRTIREMGCKTVVDITQCIFSDQYYNIADYTIGSYRKWFPIPDGAFMHIDSDKGLEMSLYPEHEQFVNIQVSAMVLRGVYFQTGNETVKNISIKLNKMADSIAETEISEHRISALSYAIYTMQDFKRNAEQRLRNYKYLYSKLAFMSSVTPVCGDIAYITVAPLYFPVYVENRTVLQGALARKKIYAPVLWPVYSDDLLISDDVSYIYSHILLIPIDQRYNLNDMERIVEAFEIIDNEQSCSHRS